MHIRLVARVEDQRITWRIERAMQRDSELHHSEVWPQVPAVRRHRRDQAVPDLRGQGDQRSRPKALQILRTTERIKECHATMFLVDAVLSLGQYIALGMTVSCYWAP